MARVLFTDEDQQLFHKIEIDIKKNPERYRNEGKWLGHFWGEDEYWQRRIDRQKLFTPCKNDPVSFKEGYDILSGNIRSIRQIFRIGYWFLYFRSLRRHLNLLKKLGMNKVPRRERAAHALEILKEQKRKGSAVNIGDRFEDAFLKLLFQLYRGPLFLDILAAKNVLLTTWLLTDPDAENAGLNITKFENWPWSDRCRYLVTCPWFGSKGDFREWIKGIRAAWLKIEAEKEYSTETETKRNKSIETEQETGTEELDEIDEKIVALYQEAEKKNQKLPSSRKIAKALIKAGITQKEYSHTAINNRKKRLRDLGLIGHPDDNKDKARRCTPEHIGDMSEQIKQKF